ncbi:helix-turn-helix domain-containing protein [Streptosporangium sandarakinum]
MTLGDVSHVPRYRLRPASAQEAAPAEHCRRARYVWNLAVERHSF